MIKRSLRTPMRAPRPFGPALLVLAMVLGTVAACREPQSQGAATPQWLLDRVGEERALVAKSMARHDFAYTDRLAESGIAFVNQVVDDAGRAYKPVHYDHGGGVAAADVDGDGLPDLFFTTQLGRNELWRNLGSGTFEDISAKAGIDLVDVVAVGASFADIDNDGDPDLLVTTVRHGNRLFENLGGGAFRDISKAAGVGYDGHSSGAVFFDYDRDGRVDLFVANVGRYTTDSVGHGSYRVGMEGAFFAHV
ncbi:MAG: VCBS repeat-containing protein, partial [Gemmatimonadota bacterium]|nr:VCBS repeat-containing protein [Gemmatimonadota bacterium]